MPNRLRRWVGAVATRSHFARQNRCRSGVRGGHDETTQGRVDNVDHGLHLRSFVRYLGVLAAVTLMTCPYCVLPLIAGQPAVERGDFLAHAGCQSRRERAGVYLTANGGMVVRTSGLNPVESACVIEMVAKTIRNGRLNRDDGIAAVEPARGARVLGAAGD